MIWIALLVAVVGFIISNFVGRYNLLHFMCAIIVTIFITVSVAYLGISLDKNYSPDEDVDNYKIVCQAEIKDFSVTQVDKVDKNEDSNDNTYQYVYCDTDKKDCIKADYDTTVVLNKTNTSDDRKEITSLTIKEKDVFLWTTFTTRKHKIYVFS